jgi:hypothetical protein
LPGQFDEAFAAIQSRSVFVYVSQRYRKEVGSRRARGACGVIEWWIRFGRYDLAVSAQAKRTRSPVTSIATPVSAAAAEQQHEYDDNQD